MNMKLIHSVIAFGAVIALSEACYGYNRQVKSTTKSTLPKETTPFQDDTVKVSEMSTPKDTERPTYTTEDGVVTKESEIPKNSSTENADYIRKLYKEMVKTNQGSFLVSPLSVQIIFGLISRGAEGNTSKQITDSLNIPKDEKTNKKFFQQLSKLLQINDQYTLSSANKIYLANNFTIRKRFNETAVDVFRSEIDTIDFGQPQEAAEMINKWVENKTHDKIHNLINSESLSADTAAVLVNALYFQGTWVKEFEETYKFPFYTTPDKQIDIDMMTISDEFKCYNSKELDAKFLELPYKGEEITMTFVLPNSHSGLSNLEDQLPEVLLTAPKYRVQSVEAIIPKFKIESTIPFVPILKSLGIKDAFNSNANFRGISTDHVEISTVVQKTFIEVDEKGTTAAAATGVGFDRISGGGFRFTANHPFLFYLKHKTLDVFFIGRYSGPSEV